MASGRRRSGLPGCSLFCWLESRMLLGSHSLATGSGGVYRSVGSAAVMKHISAHLRRGPSHTRMAPIPFSLSSAGRPLAGTRSTSQWASALPNTRGRSPPGVLTCPGFPRLGIRLGGDNPTSVPRRAPALTDCLALGATECRPPRGHGHPPLSSILPWGYAVRPGQPPQTL